MSLRKIGGIHFLRIGRWQFSFCVVRTRPIHVNELSSCAAYQSEANHA